MAIIAKQGIWSNSAFPWTDQTSAGYVGSIVAEIDAWISGISSNASIIANGMLPVKVREPSDSTDSGVNNGFGYKFPDTSIGLNADGPSYPTLLVHGTETSITFEVGDEFEDNTENQGFGDLGTSPGHSSAQALTGDVGFDRETVLFYDTTDGEEFFAVGLKVGSGTSDSLGFVIFRDSAGHWCFAIRSYGFCYDNVIGYWNGNGGPYDTDPRLASTTTYMNGLVVRPVATTGSSSHPNYDNAIQGVWYANNPALYDALGTNSRLGNYTLVNNDTEAIIMLGYASAAVRVPV